MAAPSAPLASFFHHFADLGNQDEITYPELDVLTYPELDVLMAYINTASNESIASFLHILIFVQKSY